MQSALSRQSDPALLLLSQTFRVLIGVARAAAYSRTSECFLLARGLSEVASGLGMKSGSGPFESMGLNLQAQTRNGRPVRITARGQSAAALVVGDFSFFSRLV